MKKPHCTKCGQQKSEAYLTSSWCSQCVGAKRKQARIEKRHAEGLPIYGSGRDPKCKDCRNFKEESYKNGNYCGKCKCGREKIRYALNKKPKKIGRNPFCKCGLEKEKPNDSYCTKCTNEKKRLLYHAKKQNPGFMEAQRAKAIKRYAENSQHRIKRMCREATHRRIKVGLLMKGNCEVCGISNDVEAHHPDYTDPMNVKWLCTWHHADHHKNAKMDNK